MFFLPYRMDSKKNGIPLVTLLICILCSLIYWQQYSKDSKYENAVNEFCWDKLDSRDIKFLRHISRSSEGNQCAAIFSAIRESENRDEAILFLTKQARSMGIFASEIDNFNYTHNRLQELYRDYDRLVPRRLTSNLVYDPKDMNLYRMITATLSHGDIFHLAGNLLFFYIFSACVELIVGSLVYLLFISATTVGTSLSYSYAMMGVSDALPTLGLSGVVMAGVAALGVMIPTAKIRCFFWFLIYFKIFRVPAFLIAIWYVGWDIFEMNIFGNHSYINYVAHVSGAAMGALLGLFYHLFRRDILRTAAQS